MFEIARVYGVDAAEDHGMDLLKAQQALQSGLRICQNIADFNIRGGFDIGDEVADISGVEPRLWEHFWSKDADLLDLVVLVGRHQLDSQARADAACRDPDVGNNTSITVKN